MPVTKEFRCKVHGDFEGTKALCPEGCDTVERIFKTPVGLASDRTRNIDATTRSLAKSYGMTDIQNRGGQAAKRQSGAQDQAGIEYGKMLQERYGTGWGKVPKGGSMNVKTGQIEGTGPGAAGALAAFGARPDNVLAEVKDALVPKPVLVRHDHERLQVDVNKAPA